MVATSENYKSNSVIKPTPLEPIDAETGTSHTLSGSQTSDSSLSFAELEHTGLSHTSFSVPIFLALPKTDAKIEKAHKRAISQTTQKDATYMYMFMYFTAI